MCICVCIGIVCFVLCSPPTYLPAYLPTRLTYLSTYLPTYVPDRPTLPIFLPTYLPTDLPCISVRQWSRRLSFLEPEPLLLLFVCIVWYWIGIVSVWDLLYSMCMCVVLYWYRIELYCIVCIVLHSVCLYCFYCIGIAFASYSTGHFFVFNRNGGKMIPKEL